MRKIKHLKPHKTNVKTFHRSFNNSFLPLSLPRRRRLVYRSNAPLALAKRLIRLDVSNANKPPLKLSNPFMTRIYNSDIVRSAVCAKRKIRREVLFASGKSGGNHRPPSYSLESKVRC